MPARRLAKASKPVRSQDFAAGVDDLRLPLPAAVDGGDQQVLEHGQILEGCGIWNERPMPAMQRARGGACVMSWPSKRTVPLSGRSSPVIRLNSVDLPAPFGPMMPSASPARDVER